MSVGELTEMVGDDISTVSKHLSVIKNVGLVEVDKRGLNVYYRLHCICLTEFFFGLLKNLIKSRGDF
jgi:ArsR family transcriptional regulator